MKYIYFNLLPTRVLFRLEGLYANFAELEKPVQKRWLVLNFYGPIHPRAGRPCRTVVGWPHSCTVYLFTIFEKSQWVNITVKVARWKKFLWSTKIKIPLVDQNVALNANVVNKICFKGNGFFESEVWKDRFLFLLTISTCFCLLILFKMLLAILCSSLACRDMTDFVYIFRLFDYWETWLTIYRLDICT